jgi:acyl transferase domain-containing protein
MASAELNEVTFKATGSFEKEPIAIVGMAAKFPQEARTVEDLWNFLLQARQAMTDFPKDRISRHGHYHPDAEHGGTVIMPYVSYFDTFVPSNFVFTKLNTQYGYQRLTRTH